MKNIDLRSDTVTLPSNRMRQAIFEAKLGDDVFCEDYSVNLLEDKASKITGKESALLVPSGTMGNLVSILTHCARGEEVVLGHQSHTFLYEAGGISAFGGIHSHQLHNEDDGTIDINNIIKAIRQDDVHFPKTRLISLENTHNRCYGSPLSKQYIDDVSLLSKEHDIKLHIDGARIFNAAAALNVSVSSLVENCDSLTFCLSKGMAAPVGSVICGSDEFIHSARRIRKALGGGMRQAGIIAAAGLVAFETAHDQIIIDHSHAIQLAKSLYKIESVKLDLNNVKTNIVYFNLLHEDISDIEFLSKMKENGILFFDVSPRRFRLVTHYGISKKDINFTIDVFNKILSL